MLKSRISSCSVVDFTSDSLEFGQKGSYFEDVAVVSFILELTLQCLLKLLAWGVGVVWCREEKIGSTS